VLFADMQDCTALAEELGAIEFATLFNRFYRASTHVLAPMNGVIDKMIGDEVMAFFISACAGPITGERRR